MAANQALFSCEDVIKPIAIPNETHSFACHYLEIIAKYPNTWVAEGVSGKKTTLAELSERIRCFSSGILRKGYVKGQTICLLATNRTDFITSLIGCSLSHVTISPANPAYTGEELLYQLQISESRAIILLQELVPTLQNALDKAAKDETIIQLEEIIILDHNQESPPAICGINVIPFETLIDKSGNLLEPLTTIDPKTDAWILPFSSGTTGLPKGVVLTHYNMLANMYQFAPYGTIFNTHEHDTVLGVLPMFHIYGLFIFALSCPFVGANVVLLPKFDPITFLSSIQNYRTTHLYLVPPLCLFLAKDPRVSDYDLSSVIDIASAAAPLSADMGAETVERLHAVTGKFIRLRQAWGMTELSPVGTVCRTDSSTGFDHFGHIGTVIPFTQAKIINPESGQTLAVDEEGELCIRGPQVMKEYFKNTKATAATINDEGWLLTGDIAKGNIKGEITITDRLKELIKTKGFQVAPAELEGVILSHPEVQDCCVFGLPHPSLGEAPFAAVVPKPGKTLSESQIKEFVKAKVAPYKQVAAGVSFVESIPKSASGKILRRIIRARFL